MLTRQGVDQTGTLTLSMESERHFPWRKWVTSWTRLLNTTLARLASSLNLSHKLNWKVIFCKFGDKIIERGRITKTQTKQRRREDSSSKTAPVYTWKANTLAASAWSSLMGTMAHQLVIRTHGLHESLNRKCRDPPAPPVPLLIVCSHTLRRIISELWGVRGSHSAEVNCRPGHTQFRRVGGQARPRDNPLVLSFPTGELGVKHFCFF